MFSALRNRDYRTFASGAVVSNVGTWMQRIGQDWLVLNLTHNSASALGIVTGIQFLPTLLATPFGGSVADRFHRRKTLLTTQLSSALCAGLLALASLTGHITIHGVYAAAFLLGLIGALEAPVRSVFLHDIVDGDDLPNAIALNSASFNAARLIGPALAGLLIAGVGVGWAIAANAISYLAVALSLLAIGRTSETHAAGRSAAAGSWRQALAYIGARRDILLVLVILFAAGTFGLNFAVSTVVMATQVFGKGAAGYGALSSVMAVGSLAGALLAARRPVTRIRVIVVAATGFGLAEILAGLAPTYLTFAVLLPVVGLASLTMMTAANSYVQLAADSRNRGRVMAIYALVFMGGTPIGSPFVGWLGDAAGPRWTLLAGGIITAGVTLVAGVVFLGRVPRPSLEGLKETAAAFA